MTPSNQQMKATAPDQVTTRCLSPRPPVAYLFLVRQKRSARVNSSEAEAESWPAHLDALVAAPEHHTLLFENDAVRILDTRIVAGGRTPIHTHRWPAALYILRWSAFVRRDARGEISLDSRSVAALAKPPQALWTEALAPHSLENVGASDLHVISVEMKIPLAVGAGLKNA